MTAPHASSAFVSVFGSSHISVVINVVLIGVLAYLVWRFVLVPAFEIASSLTAALTPVSLAALEITPPRTTHTDPLNTQSLLAVLQQHLEDHQVMSLEIVGTKKTGIRYRVVADERLLPSIQKHFASYMPELKFKEVGRTSPPAHARLITIRQGRHYALPLKPHADLAKSDPIDFIAGAMTQLQANEEIIFQLVVRRYESQQASRLYRRLSRHGRVALGNSSGFTAVSYWWVWLPALVVGLLLHSWQLGVLLVSILLLVRTMHERGDVQLTNFEEQLYADIAGKLEQPLFQTAPRLSITSPDRTGALVNECMSALKPLNTAHYQYLKVQRPFVGRVFPAYAKKLFADRLLPVLPGTAAVLSAEELSMLFHFPHGTIVTAGMARSHSRTLPAPVHLHNDPKLDVVIGINKHHGIETPIGLTASERERHMFIVGGTGSGKTTMLKYQIVQDIRNGKGVAVIDPHGDLAEELLQYVPAERQEDLIYFDPTDLEHPFGVNLLEIPQGLSGTDLLREKDRVTEAIVSVMRKLFSDDDSGGHRVEYVLRNTVQTALTLESPTLFTIFRLLNDNKFANSVVRKLEDKDLKLFWKDELGKAGSMQKVKMAAGITAKIGRFLFSASARAVLGQEHSTIDFSEVLDGKILICNFSKGKLGEDTSTLFGTTILAKLQLASLKRAEQKLAVRLPFYLYVDEFQNFATLPFTQMLSEARKYKLYVTMAEQSTQQQDNQKLVDVILANTGTVVVFRTGSPKDEQLLLPLFTPYLERGDIANLPAYTFYCRIAGLDAYEPMSGETIVFSSESNTT
ncbi:MAG TPA: type IV secretion system DNA-binding domain-containing protein [Candidatus Saccharimonadales bacterium]|nr:type IV secretion system DNA-binding domain-containing protein [Candidatus Saccharimonadales bacterium]